MQNFRIYAVLLCVAGLLACENEQEKLSRLHRNVQNTERALETRQKDWEALQEEKQKAEQTTAKERFAFLQKFVKKQWKACPNSKYISEIEFEGPVVNKTQYEYMANVKFHLKEIPAKPYFLIHLYNAKGLLLGACKEINTKITQPEKQYKILADSAEEPAYFRIELMDETL
jgi:outer membrane murein-binding lipoprotein Lpp